MKRILLLAAMALALCAFTARGAWAFGVKDVVAMHQAGIADSLIVQKIRHSGAVFHLNSKDLVALHEAGVSDRVVAAMLRTEDRNDYYRAYYPYYGPYWGWPYAPVWVGFDFVYGPRYFGPWHGYRSFYGPRAFGRVGFRR